MTWPTHAFFGISTLWLMAPLPPEIIGYDFGTLAAFAAFGALLPDLDASESKIKHIKLLGTSFKPFLLPSQTVHRSDQHRGLLHSLTGLGMIAGLSTPLIWFIGWAPVIALMLGYASHLVADSATKFGILPWYPRRNRWHLLPGHLRITTGSQAEELLFAVAAGFAMALLLR